MTDPADDGLGQRARDLVCSVLARHAEVAEARLFGSRALGRHRPESDVDLALYGDVDEVLANRIAGELEELPLPYTFDVCAVATLRSQPLREHIARVGQRLFVRAPGHHGPALPAT